MKILTFVGTSGSGKTTLLARLARALRSRGLRVGVVKHSHHARLDKPGSDSQVLREAGVERVAVVGGREVACFRPVPDELEALAGFFQGMDVVLGEGFKDAPLPKVEVHRRGRRFRCSHDPRVLAVVSETAPPVGVAWFLPTDLVGLEHWVEVWAGVRPSSTRESQQNRVIRRRKGTGIPRG